MACLFSFVDEYPGMYSRNGVKAIKRMVRPINPIVQRDPVTKTLSRLNLKEIFSSKVLSLRITRRYLCKSFLLISFLFLTFFAIMDKDKDAVELCCRSNKFYNLLNQLPRCVFTYQKPLLVQAIKMELQRYY